MHHPHPPCCRAPPGQRLRPYDLQVVPRQAVGKEYFIMSATGVMMVHNGEQAEFTPLAKWARDKMMFDLVSKIDYFKNYLTRRCFRRWLKVRAAAGG
jgi:dynein heavy chain